MRLNGSLFTVMFAASFLRSSLCAHGETPVRDADGFVAHQVVIPRLQPPAELGTDLTKPPWDKAALITGNLDWRRVITADVPIRAYLFYDREALWIGYRCETKPGSKLKAVVRDRDKDMKQDDTFTFDLDAGPTGRIYYRFVINPNGALFDTKFDRRWNSHASFKTSTDDKGWTAVMRLPFTDVAAGEPAVDTVWTFNVTSHVGSDTCWAPVLGGYHQPEEFARLVFGGEQAKPIRMIEFKPLRAGANAMSVQAPAGTRCLVEAVNRDKQVVLKQENPIDSKGRVEFTLLDDRTHHVNFTFKDSDGKDPLRFWRPAEIPELLSRLPLLRERADLVRQSASRFPESMRSDVTTLLKEVDGFTGTPKDSIYKQWTKLHADLVKLERRLTDAWLYAQTLSKLSAKSKFAIALATPMDKVMIKDFPCQGWLADQYDLRLARNEHEAMQVVVIPMTGPLKHATVTASPAVGKDGQAKLAGRVTASLVGHVKTAKAGSYLPDYVGWYPDPILDFQQSCDVQPGEHVAFWVDVNTEKNARPGDYESTITVSAEGCDPLTIRLNIHVWDIELPQGTHLRNAFTYTDPGTKRLYKGRWSTELAQRYYDFILDHRLNIDSLYGKQERDPKLLRYGADKGMNAFNVLYVGANASVTVLKKLLEERMPALKKAGVDKLAYLYGFDEVSDQTFPKIKEVFGFVHSLYPGLPCMTTGFDNTFGRTTGLRDSVDIWVPLIPRYNMAEAQRLREEGKEMWWYLCVGPRHPYPNFFVESHAMEARLLMGAMSFKYQVGGVLYFLTNGWRVNDNPIGPGPYTDWSSGAGKSRESVYANGDGNIFCAGPDGPISTIRYENIRDGLEDYEFLYMLRETVASVAKQPVTATRTAYLQHARELLSVPDQVVESSSRYTNDPAKLYELRRAIAEAVIQGRGLTRNGS